MLSNSGNNSRNNLFFVNHKLSCHDSLKLSKLNFRPNVSFSNLHAHDYCDYFALIQGNKGKLLCVGNCWNQFTVILRFIKTNSLDSVTLTVFFSIH